MSQIDGRLADALDADDLVHEFDADGVLSADEVQQLDAKVARAVAEIREERRKWELEQAVKRFR